MKNKAINGLVAVLLGIFLFGEILIRIGLTIYGLWLTSVVLKDREAKKMNRVIAIITSIIGYLLIVGLFIIYFISIFNGSIL